MKIPAARKNFEGSQLYLRKARRRYALAVRAAIIKSPESVFIFAQRAIARGLFAPSCTLKDGAFSLLRAAYRHDHEGMEWFDWLDYHSIGTIWWLMSGKQRRKMGKPVIRTVA